MYQWIHNSPRDYFVLGDGGFGITKYLVTPFDASQVASDPIRRNSFNYQLSAGRVRIEQVFGIRKKIFPILASAKHCDFVKHTDIVECCCVLFSILIEIQDINTSNMTIPDNFFNDNMVIKKYYKLSNRARTIV